MKRIVKNKAVKLPMTRDDVMDAIEPKRIVDKTAAFLEKHKAKGDPRTREVNSRDFGFTGKNLTLFILPGATDEQIIEKFSKRLKHASLNDFTVKISLKVARNTTKM